MVILSATDITKSYGTNTIISNISFHINEGDRIGIIGDNGAGKTTLLSILSGELNLDSGDFFISSQTSMGYLKQSDNFSSENTVYEEMLSIFSDLIKIEKTLEDMSNEISERSLRGENVEDLLHEYDDLTVEFKNRGGYNYHSEINGILTSMAFSQDFYSKQISTLSGGERTRLALASLLLRKPDLLLLDEPTNHLDIGTLKWLEQYLKSYSGTIVLISHDRYFLDQTVNRIFEIERRSLNIFDGNYTSYIKKKQALEEAYLSKYNQQRKELERQEEIIRRFKQHGTEKLVKRAQSREKRLEHIERLERPKIGGHSLKLNFKQKYQSGKDVLLAQNISKSFHDEKENRILFQNIDLEIKRGERICLVGPNGIGKTTLLKILMGQLSTDTGFVKVGHNVVFGYYDQDQQLLNRDQTVLDELHDTYRLYNETELRSLLGRFLFQKDDVFKKVEALSGGEKARLSLLKLMLSGANLLMMDEPTNHLDIGSKEVFENALLDFPGTLLMVSHDRYFLNKIPTRIFELSTSGIESYLGSYDYYLEKKQSITSVKGYLDDLSKITSATSKDNKSDHETSSKEQRIKERKKSKELEAANRRQQRELDKLENEIYDLEQDIKNLEKEMCKDELLADYQTLTSYSEKLDVMKETLKASYSRWLDLQ